MGATGQVGSLVVRRLRTQGKQVRAMVRDATTAADLAATGAELVVADMRAPETLDAALDGVAAVVATANAIAPSRRGDTSRAIEEGYAELIRRARRAGVERVVFASVPTTPLDERVPLARPYATLRRFRRLTGRTIDRHGVMVVPRPARARQAFLSVHDAAGALAAAVDPGTGSGAVDLGGPESLSWTEVAAIYQRVLGRRVRVVSQPAGLFAVLSRLQAPVAPSLAGVLGLNRLLASSQTDRDTSEVGRRFGLGRLRTVEEVLRGKAAVPVS